MLRGDKRAESLFDLGNPVGEGFVVIHIALGDRGDALRTEAGQALVEIMAAFAEVRVVGVAQGKDREVDGGKWRGVRSTERGVERVGHTWVAEQAGREPGHLGGAGLEDPGDLIEDLSQALKAL